MEKVNTRFGKRFMAMVLALAMIIGMLPGYGFAAEKTTATAMQDKVSDPSTVNTYKDLLGAFADGNRYAGRLWTDKSVFDSYDTLADALGGELTADQLAQLTFGPEEFLIAYSSLGSTTSVSTETIVSSDLDVVIVLDISASMGGIVTDANGNEVTRLEAVTDAANMLISGILENSSNRLALVTYSTDASVILDLDSYAQTDNCLTAAILSNGQVESNGNARVEEGDATLGAKADSLTDNSSVLQGQTLDCYQRGTNLQSGINEAMSLLYNAENTENRTPVLIVMTDGVADTAAYRDMIGDTSGDGNYKQPQDNTITSGVALSTLLNAAYWKHMLNEKYGSNAVVHTVGVDVSTYDDASVVLDPASFFNAENTGDFSSVALAMLEYYTEWSESNATVQGDTNTTSNGGGRPSSSSSSFTWTFPQPATEAIKTGIEANICYADQYHEVNSASLNTAFDDILTSISSMQEAFEAIEKTDITNGESSMVYVDFIGDYMELKDFKGISLYGKFYSVALNSTNTTSNSDGTVTAVSTYKIVDDEMITDPITGDTFWLSENVIIELKHTYAVDAQGNRTSAGEQDLWIHIDEQVLPLIYHKVETKNGVTTYTVYDALPVRFYYTVGISEYVIPAGNLLLHRIDAEYLAANTGADGTVYFYANQYFAQDDDETLVNHTQDSGYGDAHNAVTPDASNRYYIHQYNYPIYISIVDASGQAVTMDPDTYGTPYDSSYVATAMTYADIANLSSTTRLYTDVTFHAPTGSLQQTTADGGQVYAGESEKYYVFTDWGHLLEDVIFYDTVNGVYINADGTTSADKGVWNENYTYEQYLETVAAYLKANTGVNAEDLEARMAIGSWRIPRFANRTFAKTENPTGTASLRVAPVRDSDDKTAHEGSMVAWLGNNGRIGYTAQTAKTVTDAEGNDLDGQLVVIGDVLTYTITATNYEETAATIVITDTVPVGTDYITGSADNGGVYAAGTLTWTLTDVPVGETVTVSYQVKVTGENMAIIENTAYITIGNNPRYETNTTENPPVGKVSDSSQYTPEGEVQVGDILTYTIYYHNNTDAMAEVTITDTIPTGTTYVDGSASYHGTEALQLTEENGKVILTWTIAQVPAGQSGSVHFQVRINADAVNPIDNAAEIIVGDNGPVVTTNTVTNELAFGDLSISKTVATGNAAGDQDKYFALQLQSAIEGVSALNGTYAVTGSSKHTEVTFVNGAAELLIKHGETITIHDLPAGITVTVYEQETPGYSAVYSADFASIVANETAAVSITNTYNVTPTSVTLTGSKVFTGMKLDAEMFTFLVYDENGDVVAGATNAADGTITFSDIHYAAAGEYTYTVVESNTGAHGVTYDTTKYTVTVTVTDDGNGVLTASVAYPEGGLVFTNTYTPKEVTVDLEGIKNLEGDAADGIAAGEFSFNVYAYDITTGTVGELVSAGTTVADDSSAAINFAPIGFTLADMIEENNILASKDFYFLVEEDIPTESDPTYDAGMHYDTTKYLVKVTVTYDAVNGVLSVGEPSYSVLDGSGVTGMTFTNVQNLASVEVTPIGYKTTANAPDGVTFSFSVINTATNTEAGVGVGQANGDITFSTLSFSEPGTYVYTIKESNAGNTTNGITYDDAIYYMTVEVVRNSENKLVATVTYTDADGNSVTQPEFHNAYNAAGYINLTAKKELTGRDLKEGEFAFKLVRQDNGGEIDGIAAADGTITFATMYYSKSDFPAGENKTTIHYVMSEVNNQLPGVTYDKNAYDVYVTIVDNGDGTISAFLSDKDGNALPNATETGITFTNTYAITDGTDVKIQVNKNLTGRQLKAEEFSFVLYRNDGQGNWKNVASAVNTANGAVSFTRYFNATTLGHLAFDENGLYTVLYRIDEVNNHLAGIQYDNDSIYVQVVIRHDEANASYVVESVGYFSDEACQNNLDAPAFENTYSTTGTALTPVANKELSGRTMADGEFSFVITDQAGNVVSYGTNKANGEITFTAIHFEKAGTYVYTIQETNAGKTINGITYDDAVYTMTVTVTDNGQGQLVATAVYSLNGQQVEKVEFANSYTLNPVTVQPSANKVLDGKNLKDGEFTFVLTDAQGNEIETATNKADGSVMFSQIEYTQPGVYEYKIYELERVIHGEELQENDQRYTFSETVYEITVTVTDDGKGNLYASYHIFRKDVEVGAVTFYNQFTPDPIGLDLNDKVEFGKEMRNPDGTAMGKDGFEFEIYNWNGDLVASATSDAEGYIDFEPNLVFTAAGTYHYRIVEVDTDTNGVSYDTTVWAVTVTVAYDAETGVLSIKNVYYGVKDSNTASHDGITFVNTYDPTDVEVTIDLVKELTGRDLVAGEFTFRLMSGNTVVAETTNDAQGNVTFNLTFDQVGTYHYTVVEVKGQQGGVDFDESVKTVTVKVTDDGNGNLTAVAELANGNIFNNSYDAADTSATLTARKLLEGRVLKADEFTFVLTDATGKTVEATNDANGVVNFGTYTYTEPGVHVYTIQEKTGEVAGVTYSTRVYTATVTVTDDLNGQLVATVVYTYQDSNGVTQTIAEPLFKNVYKAEDSVVELAAKKVLTGRLLQKGEFTFLLTDAKGNVIKEVKNDADGIVSFGTYTYTEAGTYIYKMKEVKGDLGGVTYSELVYTVTVVVTDNGEGKLVAAVTYTCNNETVAAPVFTNTYEAEPDSVQFTATKVLEGKNLANGEFTFVLTDENGNVIEEVTNAANGNIAFSVIEYTEAGTYTYKLYEKAGNDSRYTYSDAVYEITVVVTDDGKGTITAEVTYSRDGKAVEADEVSFYNEFTPAPIELDLSYEVVIHKVMEDPAGTGISVEGYTFHLYSWDGKRIASTKSTKYGLVYFMPNQVYTEAGTYRYRIMEEATGANGMIYDESVWAVTVEVVYDADTGLLRVADVSYVLESGNGTTDEHGWIEFVNTYDPTPTQVTINLNKLLTGRDLVAGEFTFQLRTGGQVVAEATNDAEGNVTFQLHCDKVGEFVYTVVEVNDGQSGVIFDDTMKTITVTVTDNRQVGALEATVEIADGDDTFENIYQPAGASLAISAQKLLEGRMLREGEFTFELIDAEGNILEAANAADGTVLFDTIAYTEPGVYVYTIREQVGTVAGVTYSTRIYTATVTVTDDLNGQLVASVVYTYEDANGATQTIAEPVFNNVYEAANGTVELFAQKVLNGRDLVAGEFTFVLTDENGNVIEATNNAYGVVSFGTIPYTEAGTYTYTIHEKTGTLGGVTYSDLVYTVTVTVTDDGNGKLIATAVYKLNGEQVQQAVFTNTYAAGGTQIALEAFKSLEGRMLKAGEFTFVLTDANGNVVEATNAADGTIYFGVINYTEAGTYTYTIREKAGTLGGVTYSELAYIVTVIVTDNGKGSLEAEVTYTCNGETVEAVTFVNTYKAADVQINLEAFKTMEGRLLQEGEFTFVLTDENGYAVEVTNAADGTVDFGAFTYTEAGTYTYTIREKAGTLGGVTYSDLVYTVTVTVTDNGKGQLIASVVYKCADEQVDQAIFTNVYTTGEAQVTLEAFKSLEGRMLKDGEFTFVLTDANGYAVEATNAADGTISFGAIHYTQAGTYTYTIHEKNNSLGGVTYSDLVYTVTVVVTDNGEGALVAEVTYTCNGEAVEAATFVNTYEFADVQINLEAYKTLEGELLQAGAFIFVLTDANGNVVEVTNAADGTVDFGTITYTEAGTYTYTVCEQAGTMGGVTYSDLVYTVTVVVTDNGEGALVAEVTYTCNGETVEAIHFVNTYKAADVQINLEAYKTLEGRMLKADEFTFVLTDANGNVVEVTNAADGTVDFGTITYTQAGTYTYTIHEKNNSLGGVTYSDLVYTVTVVVTDNGQGALVAEVTYTCNGEAVETIAFTNTYEAANVQITLEAFKSLEGRMLRAGEFTFVLTDENGNVVEVTNAAEGNINFGAFTYTEAGTYTYTVYEKAGTLGGVTYSDLVYTVTVVVTDNGEGALVAEVTYTCNGEAAEAIRFVNTYETADVQVTLEAFKTLEGRMLKADEFTFVLTDANGNVVEVTNAADGTIFFDAITYTEAGTYVYALHEKTGEAGGVTYSNLVYVVTVIVTDNGEGQLLAEVIYDLDGEVVEKPVFVNNYEAGDVSVAIEAIKTLQGKTLEEGAFTFVLTDENGNVLEATNAADGTIRFADIVYTEAGLYLYTLSEIRGDEVAMVYDETVYTILVAVVDNGEGALEIESVMIGEQSVAVTDGVIVTGIEFVNVYDPIPETGDNSFGLPMLMMSASILALAVLLLAEKNRRRNA